MVEGAGFQLMLKQFNPGYSIPSRTHFGKLLEKKYQDNMNQVKDTLSALDSQIAITADIWTSVANEAYLGITCHYIGTEWQMESICLSTMPLEDRHTAQNIAMWLQETLEKFEINPEKVSAIVHDNGANIVAAAKLLEAQFGWASIRCTGHTLQLVLIPALSHPVIAKAVGAARCLVEHLKKSELASTKLKEKQQQMGTPAHTLIQDVSTRWNSTYHMISRLLEQRWPVTATLSDPHVTKSSKQYLDLKPEQWSLLGELSTALEPFDAATEYMSGEKYTTISSVPPLIKGLVKSVENMDFETVGAQVFQKTAKEQLEQRWSNATSFSETSQNTVIVSSSLDPRFKKLKFLSAEDSCASKVEDESS
uniref:Uncharacterized protein n=1 Tax=Nothobranchius furzeri TaxID=105023 RepID=A0A1A8ACL7_NOTFU